MRARRSTPLFVVASCLWCTSAWAQAGDAKVGQFVPNAELSGGQSALPQGWVGTLSLNANVSINHNSNVVGQLDGASFIMGGGLVGTLVFRAGAHEVLSSMSLTEAFAKTPALTDLVKTNDTLRLESIYNYFFLDWLGAFGRIGFDAPIFHSWDRRAAVTNWTIAHLDGTNEMVLNGRELRLASAFQPLTLTESAGLVAKPLAEEPATVSIRAGIGGRETFAKGVLVDNDDKATPAIELKEVDNVIQGGAEAAIGIVGKFPTRRLSYAVDFGMLLPVFNNDKLDRGAFELLRIGLAGNLVFSTFDWMALTYQVRVTRDKQLFERLQVQNSLFLTFTYDLIAAPKPEGPDPADTELAKAQEEAKLAIERANLAEERANTAEERAKLAEERAKLLEEKSKAPEETPPPATPEETPPPATP
jgi:hypothetical protein